MTWYQVNEFISLWFVLLYLSIRNLSLGAKAETAIGKHYIDLKHETRKQLMKLLSDDNQNGTEKAVWV